MEKIINLLMDDKNNIIISIDGAIKYIITKENRKINAQDLYDSLEFKYNETTSYKINSIQEQNSTSDAEYKVLKNFYNLFKSIVDEINVILAPKEEASDAE